MARTCPELLPVGTLEVDVNQIPIFQAPSGKALPCFPPSPPMEHQKDPVPGTRAAAASHVFLPEVVNDLMNKIYVNRYLKRWP